MTWREGGKNGRTDGGGSAAGDIEKEALNQRVRQLSSPPSDVIRTEGMKGGKEGVVFLLLRVCERERQGEQGNRAKARSD